MATYTNISSIATAYVRIDADRNALFHDFLVITNEAPTFEVWEGFRVEFQTAYKGAKAKATDEAAQRAWSRFVDAAKQYADENDYDLTVPTKPKATTPEAVRKQEARKLPEAILNAKTVADLDAIELPADPLAAAVLSKQIADTKVRMLKLESKAAEKAVNDGLKVRRDALIAFIKSASAEQLAELEAMKEHNVTMVLAALPATDVQAAAVKLVQLTQQVTGTKPTRAYTKKGSKGAKVTV